MVEGATASATARLLLGELTYDHFLAEISQATVVDLPGIVAALERLVRDESLTRRMGDAGRRRACELFAWPRIIRLYEELWLSQEAERCQRARLAAGKAGSREPHGPAAYPAPERSFAGYPSHVLRAPDRLAAAPGAASALDTLLAMPLTHHAPARRVPDPALLRDALALAPCSVNDFDRFWSDSGIDRGLGRSTIAWMLKYDLLRRSHEHPPAGMLPS
jgi:hypothetical protein